MLMIYLKNTENIRKRVNKYDSKRDYKLFEKTQG